ncbi:beta-galactosidase BglA [Pararhizobium mangrovi]|uniref:DUF3459 domain-containing protein n=1 Tax=Pararhizobium mangrovi TaxID=2590452 RepID=A0A506UER5_9HYPH|nr:alpha-glucosidase family protein [Pararhizobium mangrovi]TPW31269.1 DUF3459 domain-containing protein [Pararhizobium mangrovi]
MNVDNADWWRGAVIYQIYPRSFQDTTGDGIGDLAGIAARLRHAADLGADAVWLSPFFRSPMDDMGYDVSDYCAVEPMFGTLADFDSVVERAHELGLKVVIDQVLSHTSSKHAWFEESRAGRDTAKADWYVWAEPKPDGTPPNNWLSIFGGPAWEWDGVRGQYYLHNFLASQPDLNFHNPEVQDAILETVRFWLERGVDGFRLDTANFYFHDAELRDNPPPPAGEDAVATLGDARTNPYDFQDHIYDKTRPENLDFLRRFRSLLDSYEGRTSVGEVSDGARSLQTVARYTAGSDKLHMCYTFDLLTGPFSAAHFRRAVENFKAESRDGWVCWSLSNHDVVRHVTRWAGDGEGTDPLARFGAALVATLEGSICLYQGEELGLGEAELAFEDLTDPYGIRFWPAYKGRDGCRTPMVWEKNAQNAGFSKAERTWLPVPEAHRLRAVDTQEEVEGSILEHYRAVLSFRRRHPVLKTGTTRFLTSDDDILAFVREGDGERLLFAFNFARRPAEWRLPDGLTIGEPVAMPGFAPAIEDNRVRLGGLDVFCARLG